MKSWSWISPLIMCQDIVSPVISHSWELFILGFWINFLLNHFIYLWRTGLENLFVNFYVFVVHQYRSESSQSGPDIFPGARSFSGAANTSTWTCPPPRCGNTSGNSSSPSTTASPRAEQRYRSGARRPTTKFDLKTLKDNKNNAEFHHEIVFKYFISRLFDCSEGADINCLFFFSFFLTFPVPFLQKPSTALLEEVEKENNIKNNDYVSNYTFGHNI